MANCAFWHPISTFDKHTKFSYCLGCLTAKAFFVVVSKLYKHYKNKLVKCQISKNMFVLPMHKLVHPFFRNKPSATMAKCWQVAWGTEVISEIVYTETTSDNYILTTPR